MTCPSCDGIDMVEIRNGIWICPECGWSEER